MGLASERIVDCWIGIVREKDRCIVRLAGRLSAAQVPELLGACAPPLEVDLSELVSADVAGVEALQRLRDQGARLVAAPGYLQMKLDAPAPNFTPSSPKGRPTK